MRYLNPGTALANGTQGGRARVATLRHALRRNNPNTFTILAGDLLSPAALGTAKVNGQRLAGQQMVATMNALGLDYATFGNHEFDLKRDEFLQRLSDSKAQWLSSNVTDARGEPFPGVAPPVIFTATSPSQQVVRIGLFGLTLDSNRVDWATYRDPFAAAKAEVAALRGQVDTLIAVTHLALTDDVKLVEALPQIDLVLGGHEHEHYQLGRGPRLTPILKADANARTVDIVELRYNTAAKTLAIDATLQPITANLADDPAVGEVVQHWVDKAHAGFRAQGFEPARVVTSLPEALDGSEASVRNRSTRLTELIAEGMREAVPGAAAAIFDSGALRLDDTLGWGRGGARGAILAKLMISIAQGRAWRCQPESSGKVTPMAQAKAIAVALPPTNGCPVCR